ncbi:unnamed protein product [Rotaria sp. Silwood1]|nr:unnamed protein product [Rotaria sp. Silwood1]
MIPDRTKCELAHLYFNPKKHKDGIPVRPIESTIRASTRNISKFLDHIIRTIFDKQCRTTTIIDGTSLIQALNKHIKKGLFKSSTLFCIFDIRNLYTMLPQDEALDILIEFIHVHGYTKVKGIDLQTIKELASIVLKENVFVYDKKIYRQTIGGAMVRRQDISNEFYGRYIDDIFIPWNKSEKELIKLLEEANIWHPNIELDYKIGQSLPFLDVLVMNDKGNLSTSVYHKPAVEPYVVPSISDHPRDVFSNVIQTALARAIRYSSTFETYQQERRNIKLMLLYNSYPSSFIETEFQKFYRQYIPTTSSLSFIPNENEFFLIRHKLLNQPTARQSQLAMSATRADLPNYSTYQAQIQSKQTTKNPDYQEKVEASKLIFTIHMKNDSNHLNEICIKFTTMSSRIH